MGGQVTGQSGGRRILVIHNPTAGSHSQERLGRAVDAMRAAGAEVLLHRTACAGDAEAVARDCEAGIDVVVACGGDGTVNEVINGLGARPPGSGAPALGILPLGTANLLAHELGYPARADRIGTLMARGELKPIYLAECNGRRFTLMAGAGFDGGVVDRTDIALKRRVGPLAYVVQLFRELAAYDPAPCLVSVDGAPPVEAWSVVVAKGRRYGGPFHLAREADVRDPYLHACMFLRKGRLNVVSYLIGVATGQIHRWPGYAVVRGSRITVTGRERDPVQVDGDRGWSLPLDIRSCERPQAVVAP